MKETLIVVVLIIPAITTVAVLGTILPFLDNNVSQHAFAQTNTSSTATNNMTVAKSEEITASVVPQGTSLNATSSQQQQGQQQQGQANETRSPQQMSGPITAAEGGKPFGGEKVGTISIDSTGNRTNISADLNLSPGEGNVFEGWLVDAGTGGSGYKLSLGQFRNGTLDFSQNMVNPYTYKNFEVTEEPAEDPDPGAADSIAGFELQDPFGK